VGLADSRSDEHIPHPKRASSPELRLQQHTSNPHASSLRRASLACARWCLAQTKALRLSESSSESLGLFLQVLPGRGLVTWARTSGLATIRPAQPSKHTPNSSIHSFNISQWHHTRTKHKNSGKMCKEQILTKIPSFPYLEWAE